MGKKKPAPEPVVEEINYEEIDRTPMPQDVCVMVLKVWDVAAQLCVEPSREQLSELSANWGITVLDKASLCAPPVVEGAEQAESLPAVPAEEAICALERRLKSDVLARAIEPEPEPEPEAEEAAAEGAGAAAGSEEAAVVAGGEGGGAEALPPAIYALCGFTDTDADTGVCHATCRATRTHRAAAAAPLPARPPAQLANRDPGCLMQN